MSDTNYLDPMRGEKLTERKAMRCSKSESENWERAAAAKDLSWSAWAADVLNAEIESKGLDSKGGVSTKVVAAD